MEQPMDRQLGVFGPRNSGKTTFWACLYASKGSTNGTASFPEEQTRQQLEDLWRLLSRGTLAPATAQGEPTDIAFQFHSHAVSWRVSTKDYSGSLVELSRMQQPVDDAARDLRRHIAAWIGSCDAMLVLVPADLASQNDDARRIYRRAMESLLAVFNESTHPGPLPICLAVTKSDLLPVAVGGGSSVLTGEPQGALPPWLDELVALVRHQVGEAHVKVFLTSAFGGHDLNDPARPPRAGPTPKGLEEPLTWILRASDRCLSDAAITVATRSLQHWPHRYTKAIRYCERVAAKGLPPKETGDIRECLEKLTKARRRQRRLRSLVTCIILFAATMAALWLHADHLQNRANATIGAGAVTPESLKGVCAFLKSPNPLIPLLFHGDRKRAIDWYNRLVEEQSRRVRGMLALNNDMPQSHWQQRVARAEERATACDIFCQLFPNSSERFEFERERKRARDLIDDLKHYGPFDNAFADLVNDLEREKTSEGARARCSDFRKRYPPERYPLRADAYERLNSIVESKVKGEQYARFVGWEATIRADYEKDPRRYSDHITAINNWLSDYASATTLQGDLDRLADGLRTLRREISRNWDIEDYRKLQTAAGRMFEDPDKLGEAIRYGDRYVSEGAREERAMREYVDDWLSYARGLNENRRIGITAAHINVANSSKFSEFWGGEEVMVELRMRANVTAPWSAWSPTAWITLEDHKGALGESRHQETVPIKTAQLDIRVTEYDLFEPNDTGSRCYELLKLVERFQEAGKDDAVCEVDVEGAKVTIKLTGLPKRVSLPTYGKSR